MCKTQQAWSIWLCRPARPREAGQKLLPVLCYLSSKAPTLNRVASIDHLAHVSQRHKVRSGRTGFEVVPPELVKDPMFLWGEFIVSTAQRHSQRNCSANRNVTSCGMEGASEKSTGSSGTPGGWDTGMVARNWEA